MVINLGGVRTICADDIVNNVNISGFVSFDGKGITYQVADVTIGGAENTTLRVILELTARISGSGSVNYHGNPEVTRRISGAGLINRIEE